LLFTPMIDESLQKIREYANGLRSALLENEIKDANLRLKDIREELELLFMAFTVEFSALHPNARATVAIFDAIKDLDATNISEKQLLILECCLHALENPLEESDLMNILKDLNRAGFNSIVSI